MPKKEVEPGKVLRPLRAIRAKCLDCCGGNTAEVRRCHIKSCPLHSYRMGHRPKTEKSVPTGDILNE